MWAKCASDQVSGLVELRGFEPLTSSMPWKRATNCAIAPRECSDRLSPAPNARTILQGGHPAMKSVRPEAMRVGDLVVAPASSIEPTAEYQGLSHGTGADRLDALPRDH
jgi:hypothetical protein